VMLVFASSSSGSWLEEKDNRNSLDST